MAEQLQFRRGTTVENATFVGAVGEVSYDTQKKHLIPHDGITAGGFPMGGFVQSGAGAVIRSAESKLKDFVSVKDFGAVGDNDEDDTDAIQAAFNSGAGAVIFPAGEYKVTSRIIVPANKNITIEGYGSTLRATSVMLSVIQVTVSADIESITIRGLHVDGGSVAATGIFVEADAGSVKNITVENNVVENFNNPSSEASVFGIRVDGLGADHISILNNAVRNLNRVTNNFACVGVFIQNIVNGCLVSGNDIRNITSPAGTPDADGVSVFSHNRLDNAHQTAGPVITGNYFYNVKGRFVKSQSAYTIVTSNRFEINNYDVATITTNDITKNNFKFVDLQSGSGIIANNTGWWKPNTIAGGDDSAFAIVTIRDYATDENQYLISNNNLTLNQDLNNFVFQWTGGSAFTSSGTLKVSDNVVSSEFNTYNVNNFALLTPYPDMAFLDVTLNNNHVNHLLSGAFVDFYSQSIPFMCDDTDGPTIAALFKLTLTNNAVKSEYPTTDLVFWPSVPNSSGDPADPENYAYFQHLMISGNTNFSRSEVIAQGMDVTALPEGTSFLFTIAGDGDAGNTGGLVNAPTNAPFNFSRYVVVERVGENWCRLSKFTSEGVALFRTDTPAGFLYSSATALTF